MAHPLPSEYTFGKVIGRAVHAIADSAADEDHLPEARPAVGRVRFTPKTSIRKAVHDYSAFVLKSTVHADLDELGRIIDAEGRLGIWLVTGHYDVSFSLADGQIPGFTIEVTDAHTDESPLDLVTAAPPQPGPGITVQTVIVPTGASTGQVLGWTTDGLGWIDPEVAGDASAGSRLVSGTVMLTSADQTLPPFVLATTTGATVQGEHLPAGGMAAFWYWQGAWHVMLHGIDMTWRPVSTPGPGLTPVTPTGPTWVDNTTDGGGTWTTPSQTGIVYSPSSGTATAGQSITVTATAAAGYEITGTSTWTHIFPVAEAAWTGAGDDFTDASGSIVGRQTQTGGLTWAQGKHTQFTAPASALSTPTVTDGTATGTGIVQSTKIRRMALDYQTGTGETFIRLALGAGSPVPMVQIRGDAARIYSDTTELASGGHSAQSGHVEVTYDGTAVVVSIDGAEVAQATVNGTIGTVWGFAAPAGTWVDNFEVGP